MRTLRRFAHRLDPAVEFDRRRLARLASLGAHIRGQVTPVRSGVGRRARRRTRWRAARPSGVVTSPTKTAARVVVGLELARRLAERAASRRCPPARSTFTCAPPAPPTPPANAAPEQQGREHRRRLLHRRRAGGHDREHQEPACCAATTPTDRLRLLDAGAEAVARSPVVLHAPGARARSVNTTNVASAR